MEASSEFKKFDVTDLQAKMFILQPSHSQRATFKEHGLITLKRVLVFPAFFCFTLRTMFNLSLGSGGGEFFDKIFPKANFCIFFLVLVI